MRILLATDAWFPQVNGVVRTLSSLSDDLRERGIAVRTVSPADFRTVPCPSYAEIRLAVPRPGRLQAIVDEFQPDAVHIATEGPIGLQMRRLALRRGLSFTTSFHTRFPEYLRQRAPVPERLTYSALRWFHNAGSACLVPNETMRRELTLRGFRNVTTWTRGVDRSLFRPLDPILLDLPRPIFLTVSRIAPEKNIPAFLDLDLPGSKLVVGDGPDLKALIRRYPDVHFAGAQTGEALARYYSTADAFVFPSRTDTFGLVILEALACGTPVAAYPEPGPTEVLAGTQAGVISEDLRAAALGALTLPRGAALERSAAYGWDRSVDIFLQTVESVVAAAPRTMHSARAA
ncbi:glycosyltransferase family 4 protein [Aureimonas mangrovi]|uniref:glycosyltransferase family 4 protein n=1 Tax=Aureimonas mangrovi TaxID=2758041 RepID=UPI00163D8802|nr:glycosyltransferase family 1 protein [Aureimonas mangrovi]